MTPMFLRGSGDVFNFMEQNLESSMLLRIDLENTDELATFQVEANKKLDSLFKRYELLGARPLFKWWQIQGTWPRDDGGWTVLLARATFEGRVRPPAGYGDALSQIERIDRKS